MQTVGLISLGLVGGALAERFLAHGYAVCGYDPDPARQAALAGLGGQGLPSARAVATAAPRLVLSLPTTAEVQAVLAEIGPALGPGALVLDTTTGDPDVTAGLGAAVAGYVDATIAGSSAQV